MESKKVRAEICRVCGEDNAYFACEVDKATNAVRWDLSLYSRAGGCREMSFGTCAEAEAALEAFRNEIKKEG